MTAAQNALRTVRFNMSVASNRHILVFRILGLQTAGQPGPAHIMGKVRAAQLDNGLKVLIKELHTAPLVSVWCWYRVGSGDELPGLTGVSHWVEHMN
jgi:hypothetical protein